MFEVKIKTIQLPAYLTYKVKKAGRFPARPHKKAKPEQELGFPFTFNTLIAAPPHKRKHLDNHFSSLFRSVSQELCWRTQPLISLKPQTIPQNPHSDSGRTSKDLHYAILLSSPVCLATLPYIADVDSGRRRSPL